MAGVSVKMGVDASQFKAGLQEAQNSVKTLDAALKMNEKQLKATGDAEIYMANKSKLLNKQMEEQKKVVANIQKQMAEMKGRGVEETSEAYQKLERSLYNATGKMMDIQTQLNGLADSEQNAAKGAELVSTNLNTIGKKVSFDAVIGGIGKITSGLEKAAQKAIEVGKQIWDNIMDSAAYADDVETLATRMGLTTTEVQQMQYVANRFEAPVETVAKSWKKVKMSMTSDSEEIAAGFAKLGVQTQEFSQGKMGAVVTGMRDYKDVFWETGEALMRMTDEAEQERLAQQLLGRSWDEMIPLFKAGREEYEAAMESAPVASEKAIQNAAELSDKVAELEQSFMTLKTEVVGDIAPALTAAATTLEKLITSVTDYLQTDAGQEALQNMADAVSGLFEDLGKIDPAQVVEGFTGVFNTVVEGLQWLDTNKDVLSGVLTTIVTGWGLAKLAGGALDVLNLINGLRGLNAASAAAAGEAAGAAWGGGFASAVAAAAPWLVGAYTLLNPSGTGNNDTRDANGNLIGEGFIPWDDAKKKRRAGLTDESDERKVIDLVADRFMGIENILDDYNAINVMDKYLTSGDKNQLIAGLEGLGYAPMNQPQGEYATVGNGRKVKILGQATQKITGEEQVLPGEIAEIGGALDSSADAQSSASDAMNSAAQVMQGMPGDVAAAVAAAISRVKLMVNFTLGGSHANGLSYVPYDGYLGVLHRGERVMTATENRRYTTNNYFGNVNLNNGLEIEALTESIDRRNRRQMAGFGAM